MNNLREFSGRKLVTAEMADLDPKKLAGAGASESPASSSKSTSENKDESTSSTDSNSVESLTDVQVQELGEWLQTALPGRISKVRTTTRLRTSPAVVTDHESAALRRMMRMVEQSSGRADSESVRQETHMLPAQVLEINASHPIILKLFSLRHSAPRTAAVVAEQVLDNALVAAGLVDDSRIMLPRLTALLEILTENAVSDGKAVTGYAGAAALSKKRYTSEKEEQERATLDAMKAAVDESVTSKIAEATDGPTTTMRVPDTETTIVNPSAETKPHFSKADVGTNESTSTSTTSSPKADVGELDALLADLEKSLKSDNIENETNSTSKKSGGRKSKN
jgi:Hsp90 protein